MKSHSAPFVEVFADGACSGNPGVGGYGAILRSDTRVKELSGCEKLTTNNRMELLAVITALEALKRRARVRVVTDSTYVVKGMTEWIGKWQRQNWKNSQKKDVMNRDLWERLLKAAEHHEVDWSWIKGHNGHLENERCDYLARKALENCRQECVDEEA